VQLLKEPDGIFADALRVRAEVLSLQFFHDISKCSLAIAERQYRQTRALDSYRALGKKDQRLFFSSAPLAPDRKGWLARLGDSHDQLSILNAPGGGHPGST